MKYVARTLLALALYASCPTALQAQGNDAQADRIDSQLDRVPTRLPDQIFAFDGAAPPTSTITLVAILPVKWTNNAGYAQDDEEEAAHATPSLEMRAVRTSTSLRLEGRASISTDAYTRAEENNLSLLRFRVELGGRQTNVLGMLPYIRYQPVIEFSDAHLGTYSKTKHDFSIGGVRTIRPGTEFRLFATRRESTDPNSERFQLGMSLTIKGPLSQDERWSWSVAPGLESRFFTGGTNDGRTDIYLSTEAAISWAPKSDSPWTFNALTATVERNLSDAAGRDYFVLNIGSSISVTF
jgi:hypothetical protein